MCPTGFDLLDKLSGGGGMPVQYFKEYWNSNRMESFNARDKNMHTLKKKYITCHYRANVIRQLMFKEYLIPSFNISATTVRGEKMTFFLLLFSKDDISYTNTCMTE